MGNKQPTTDAPRLSPLSLSPVRRTGLLLAPKACRALLAPPGCRFKAKPAHLRHVAPSTNCHDQLLDASVDLAEHWAALLFFPRDRLRWHDTRGKGRKGPLRPPLIRGRMGKVVENLKW